MHFPGAGPGGAPAGPGGGLPTVASIVQGKEAGVRLVGLLLWSSNLQTLVVMCFTPGTAGGAGGLSPAMAGLPPPGQALPR